MTRKMAIVGFSYIFGLLLASYLPIEWDIFVYLPIGVMIILLLVFKATKKMQVSAVVFLVAFMVFRIYAINSIYSLELMADREVTLTGKIIKVVDYASNKSVYTVKGTLKDGTPAKLEVYADTVICNYGDNVKLDCVLVPLENEFAFSKKNYSFGKGIFMGTTNAANLEVSYNKNYWYFQKVQEYKNHISSVIRSYLPRDEGELLVAMLCGDKSGLESTVKQSMYRAGAGHVMAVSGLHVGVVAGVFVWIINRLRINKRFGFFFLALLMSNYVVFCEMSPSVSRATIMILLVYSAKLFYRQCDALNSIGIAAFIIALFSPYCVRDVSFVMSFSAVWGVMIIAPKLKSHLNTNSKLYKLKSSFVTSVAVTIAIIPASAMYFGEMSIRISPITNIILHRYVQLR